MKKIPMHIIFLITGTLLYSCSYASPAADSLPACILKMKQKDSLLTVEKYDYKGQQWFVMSRMLTLKESQMSDRMYHLEFYNKDCKLVCTQKKGGFAGLNKVLPDTIDKTKIIKIAEKVPEKIMLLAIKNNAASISEYQYLGQPLYFLHINHPYNSPKDTIVIKPYYDKTGRVIIFLKRVTNPDFTRAERWEPYGTVQPEKLLTKGDIWYNTQKRN
jgi:hypothetical protein